METGWYFFEGRPRVGISRSLGFQRPVHFFRPGVHSTAPSRTGLPESRVAFQAGGLGVKASIHLRESLVHLLPQAGQLPLQTFLQTDNEVF